MRLSRERIGASGNTDVDGARRAIGPGLRPGLRRSNHAGITVRCRQNGGQIKSESRSDKTRTAVKCGQILQTTRRDKARRLDWIRETIGAARYAAMKPRHVQALMAKKGGPVAGNRVKKDLAQLFRFAAKQYGFAGQNPAALADANKVRSRGFHTWRDDEIASFRAKHATGSKARLALELLLGTGAARQDAAGLTRRNIRGGRLCYRRGKNGAGSRPAHPARIGGGTGAASAGSNDGSGARDPGQGVHARVFRQLVPGTLRRGRSTALHRSRPAESRRTAPCRAWRDGIRDHVVSCAREREGGQPVRRGRKSGTTHEFGHGEIGGRPGTNFCPTFLKGWTTGGCQSYEIQGK